MSSADRLSFTFHHSVSSLITAQWPMATVERDHLVNDYAHLAGMVSQVDITHIGCRGRL